LFVAGIGDDGAETGGGDAMANGVGPIPSDAAARQSRFWESRFRKSLHSYGQ